MDFFGISSAKLILIFIIAIILLGPDQVPVIVKTVGKTIRDFRRFVNETTKEFNDVTGDIRKEFTDTVGDLRTEIASTQAELKSQFDFSEVMSPITDAMRDPLGALTTATTTAPEAVPVLAGATAANTMAAAAAVVNEANPLATQSVPYTPPQPMAAFATPEPEAPTPTFDFSVAPTTAPEPITVQTPYAESLAAATNGTAMPVALHGPRATKADPFADLAVLTPARPASVVEVIAPALATDVVASPASPASPAVLDAFAIAANDRTEPGPGLAAILVVAEQTSPEPISFMSAVPTPAEPAPVSLAARRAVVGHSVAATRYGRKRA